MTIRTKIYIAFDAAIFVFLVVMAIVGSDDFAWLLPLWFAIGYLNGFTTAFTLRDKDDHTVTPPSDSNV